METPKYLQTLWSYKWLLAFGLVVAIIAGFFAGFTIAEGEVESRAVKSYAASTTVLVTSPSDGLYQAQLPGREIQEGVTAPEPLDLAQSTQIYAYLVTGAQIRDAVEAEIGPLDEDVEAISAVRRTTQPAGDERFPGSLKLPVLEVIGTAATDARAEQIAAATTTAFLAFVTAQQTALAIPVANRVTLDVLTEGKAVASETSNPAIPVVVTGFAVFLAFVALAFLLSAIRSRRSRRRSERADAENAAAMPAADDPAAAAAAPAASSSTAPVAPSPTGPDHDALVASGVSRD